MRMRVILTLLLTIAAGAADAQEFGDATPSYGNLRALGAGTYMSGGPRLGASCSNKAAPAMPYWTGDTDDDGIVGTAHFSPWSNNNTLTIDLQASEAHLVLFVDADDDGVFSASETYCYNGDGMMPTGVYSFSGIKIHNDQAFARNGTNKVAVRISAQDNIGGYPQTSPYSHFFYGEVEDWLVDVDPPQLAVAAELLREATCGVPYSTNLAAVCGTPGYAWSLVSGTLPAGVTLTQVGNEFRLSGTPSAGSSTGLQQFPFTVQVTDAAANTAFRTLVLTVAPAPVVAPFKDDFATDLGWRLQGTWTRASASPFSGTAWSAWMTCASDPGVDASSTADNMLLTDTLASEVPDVLPQRMTATSPKIDCRQLTSVELRFMRWFSYHQYDYVEIEVTGDGATWHPVWIPQDMGYSPLTLSGDVDAGWCERTFDISQYAAGSRIAQVRFTLGPVNSAYKIGWGCTGAAGWNIDDVFVGAPGTPLTGASGFQLNSPGSTVIGGVTYPIAYPGYQHTWEASIDNNQSSALAIEEVLVQVANPYAQGFGSVGSVYVGDWTCTLPQSVGAGTTGYNLQGTFDAATIFGALTLIPLDCQITIRGTITGSGEPFVMTASTEYTHFYGPIPGLRVYEATPGGQQGAEVHYNDPASGLRDFGSVLVGGNSGWINIICDTTSSTAFTVNVPTLTGPNAADFTLYTQSPWAASPSQGQNNVWFSIKFSPQSPGQKTAWIEFTHTATNVASPFTFELKGSATASGPVLEVYDGSLSGPRISNGSMPVGGLNLGAVAAGAGPGNAEEIWIYNGGTQNLTLGTAALVGADAGQFLIDITTMSSSLPPTSFTYFTLYFNPSAPPAQGTAYLALVEFAHNDTGTSTPFSFTISGDVAPPNHCIMSVNELSVSGLSISSGAAASGYRRFGAQDVAAGPTAYVAIYISNSGGVDLNLGQPQLAGANPQDFVLDLSSFQCVVSYGAWTVIRVAFDPMAKGLKHAKIEFTNDDTAQPNPFEITLEGAGDDPNGVVFVQTILPGGRIGEVYTPYNLQAAGGTAPYTFSIVNGSLPLGLSMTSDGLVTGTPTGAHGVFNFRAQVMDAMGGTEEHQLEITLSPPVGYVEGGGGSGGGGGCAAGGGSGLWLLAGLPLLLARRRKNKA